MNKTFWFIGMVVSLGNASAVWAENADRETLIAAKQTATVDQQLDMAINRFVEANEIAGAVVLVADKQGSLVTRAYGKSDIAQSKAMEIDTIFWIASMTKPITGACVMMLQDEGKLSLDDPITKHLPEMQDLRLADGTPAVITIRQLLSHTSGMAELAANEAYTAHNLAEAAQRYAKVKVLFAPGTQWKYSQTSINTAARIVEKVSGLTFDAFVQQRICRPLGMMDTTFYLSPEQLPRLAKSYAKTDNGMLEETEIKLLAGRSPTDTNRLPAANGGLFSTAGDYAKFCRLLLADGQFNGQQLLSAESVKAMQTIVTGELTTGFTPGNGWGIACCVVREPQGVSEALSAGSFGHGGAYGTQAWIDPTKDRVYVLMTQRSNFGNSDASELRQEFQRAASAIVRSSSQQGLSKSAAEEAIETWWQRRIGELRDTLDEELANERIQAAGQTMQLLVKQFGIAPKSGAALYISMHGGGGAPARVNDQQWKNQIRLYEPEEGYYVAPRAPTNNWNLWHEAHIDPLFDRLISAFVVCRGVDPNRVYLMGYSAGGDGVFQLAPRMADRFAAAAMMAGHPNETKPAGLRNLPFALFMGGKDSAYNRNAIAEQWKVELAKLAQQDEKGYSHLVQIYPDLPHWMDRKDREALPWMQEKIRQAWPDKVVWLQDDVVHDRFYWLGVPKGQAVARSLIVASVSKQSIDIQSDVAAVDLYLSDRLIDLDRPITVTWNKKTVFEGNVTRNVSAIERSMEQRFDKVLAAPVILQLTR